MAVEVSSHDCDLAGDVASECEDVSVLPEAVASGQHCEVSVAQHRVAVAQLTAVVVVTADLCQVKAELRAHFTTKTSLGRRHSLDGIPQVLVVVSLEGHALQHSP